MPTAPRTEPAYGTLADHVAELGDPLEFVWRYNGIVIRSVPAGERADMVDAALEGFVIGCLGWQGPDSGYSLRVYVILRMRERTMRELRRVIDRRAELGRDACHFDADWVTYHSGVDVFDRAVDRLDLQRWADLAELSPTMRWGVELYATIGSPKDRGPWYDAARAGIRYMKIAAVSNRRRDDHWTRTRAQQRGAVDLELRRLYLDEGLTIREISDRTGMGGQDDHPAPARRRGDHPPPRSPRPEPSRVQPPAEETVDGPARVRGRGTPRGPARSHGVGAPVRGDHRPGPGRPVDQRHRGVGSINPGQAPDGIVVRHYRPDGTLLRHTALVGEVGEHDLELLGTGDAEAVEGEDGVMVVYDGDTGRMFAAPILYVTRADPDV